MERIEGRGEGRGWGRGEGMGERGGDGGEGEGMDGRGGMEGGGDGVEGKDNIKAITSPRSHLGKAWGPSPCCQGAACPASCTACPLHWPGQQRKATNGGAPHV